MRTRVLEDVVLFGADTGRSRAYLSLLLESGMRPAVCVLLCPPDAPERAAPAVTDMFDNVTPLGDAACRAGTEVVEVAAGDINASEAVNALAACTQQVVIFSGPAGALVKAPLFATGKVFLHVHPGKLPEYRGSTTMYYSLLAEEKIWVSALILDQQIDEGPVIDVMEVEAPKDRSQLDHVFDPVTRARMMVRVLTRYMEEGEFRAVDQSLNERQSYYIVHPVLKHIAILSGQQRSDRVKNTGDQYV